MKKVAWAVVVTMFIIVLLSVYLNSLSNKNHSPSVSSSVFNISSKSSELLSNSIEEFIGFRYNEIDETPEAVITQDLICEYQDSYDSFFVITSVYSPKMIKNVSESEIIINKTEPVTTTTTVIHPVTTKPVTTTSVATVSEETPSTSESSELIPNTDPIVPVSNDEPSTDPTVSDDITEPVTSVSDNVVPSTTDTDVTTTPITSVDDDPVTIPDTSLDNNNGEDPNTNDPQDNQILQGGLIDIDNPDENYGNGVYVLQDWERDLLAHLIMGEQGNHGKIGAALVAQCIKDALLVRGIYSDVEDVRVRLSYQGSLNYVPNEDVYWAIDYVFDQGRYVVKHPILYFYDFEYYEKRGIDYSNIWHETQEFIVQYGTHRYFWRRS